MVNVRQSFLFYLQWESMENYRITIKDIADELGVSTATVSNVIHGKTKKIFDKTVVKVQKNSKKAVICRIW